MDSITAKVRTYYVGGALVGTATSCLFYGGLGFLIFGLGGLYGGLKLAIILAVLQLIAIEIFWYRKAGGMVLSQRPAASSSSTRLACPGWADPCIPSLAPAGGGIFNAPLQRCVLVHYFA